MSRMMKRVLSVIFVSAFMLTSAHGQFHGHEAYQGLYDTETDAAMKSHVRELSAASLEGRKAGSEGEREAAEYVQGKFEIGDIKPGLWGGAFMYIVFFDHPEKTFSVLVYSDVDEETRTVSNYTCYGLKLEDFDMGFGQEDILQFLKECPEQRLW